MDLLPVIEACCVTLLAHLGGPLLRNGLSPQAVQAQHHLGGFLCVLVSHDFPFHSKTQI